MDKQSLDFSLLFGSAVHDVKNSVSLLVNSLSLFTEIRPPVTASESELVALLNFEALKINNDLVQLLSLYRLQNDNLFVASAEVFVEDFIEEEVLNTQALFQAQGIEVQIQCEPDLCWFFDAMLMKSVLHNVLLNVLRYGKAGVRLTAELIDNQLVLAVHDDGPGYPAQMLQRPGEISSQIDCTSSSTGLGLHFCAQVAQLHCNEGISGYIALSNDSDLGGGKFSIVIP